MKLWMFFIFHKDFILFHLNVEMQNATQDVHEKMGTT
jgi:hypothetical protein